MNVKIFGSQLLYLDYIVSFLRNSSYILSCVSICIHVGVYVFLAFSNGTVFSQWHHPKLYVVLLLSSGSSVLTLSNVKPHSWPRQYSTVHLLPNLSTALCITVVPSPWLWSHRGQQLLRESGVIVWWSCAERDGPTPNPTASLSSFREWRIREEGRARKTERHQINARWWRHEISWKLWFSHFFGVQILPCRLT